MVLFSNEKLKVNTEPSKIHIIDEIQRVDPENFENFKYLPSILELSLISKIAYHESVEEAKKETKKKIKEETKKELFDAEFDQLAENGWIKLKFDFEEFRNGYQGVGYFNKKFGNLVIAHKGTIPLGWKSLRSLTAIWSSSKDYLNDLLLYCTNDNLQVGPAYQFTRQVIENFGSKSTSISITGHSLGAWLAQITGFLIQYPECAKKVPGNSNPNGKPWHVHVYGFDSPGAFGVIEKYHREAHGTYDVENQLSNDLNYFDSTMYLGEASLINAGVHKHFGSVYQMDGVKEHDLVGIIEFWRKGDKKLKKLTDLPFGFWEYVVGRVRGKNVNIKDHEDTSEKLRISYFSTNEITFLKVVKDIGNYVKKEEKGCWENVVSPSPNVQMLDIDYSVFESFEFDHRGLILTIKSGHLSTFFNTIKFICYKVEPSNFFHDTPTIHQAICQGFSDTYVQKNILKLKESTGTMDDNRIQLPENIDALIRNYPDPKYEHTEISKFYHIQAKSPLVSVSALYHLFKENPNKEKICFLDSKSLNLMTKSFPAKLENFLSSGKVSVLIIQSNSKLDGIEKILNAKIRIILVTTMNVPSTNCSNLEEPNIYEYSPPLLFEDLDSKDQSRILNNEVIFQGQPMSLKSFVKFSDLEKCKLDDYEELLGERILTFGRKLPTLDEFQRSYYMERKFYSNILRRIDPSDRIFILGRNSDQTGNKGLYVLPEWTDKDALSKIVKSGKEITKEKARKFMDRALFKLNIDNPKTEQSLSRIVDEIKEKEKVKGRDDFILIEHVGHFYNLCCGRSSRYIDKIADNFVHEKDLHEQSVMVARLIIGEPGIGKSTFLVNLIQHIKKKNKFVIYLDLNAINGRSEIFKTEEKFLHYIFYQEADKTSPISNLLITQTLKNSVILMDGYDEILPENQNFVRYMVKWLPQPWNCPNIIIYVFSRPSQKTMLENYFRVPSYIPIPLSKDEQKSFLRKFWSNTPDFLKITNNSSDPDKDKHQQILLEEYIDETFKAFVVFESVMGIPLQLFMLATISLPNLIKKLNNEEYEDEPLFSSVFELIERFIIEKYRIFFQDKERNILDCNSYTIKAMEQLYNKNHAIISFAYLFPKEFTKLTGSTLSKFLSQEDLLQIQKIGMIYQIDLKGEDMELKEIHRLILEYFAARFITWNLKNLDKKNKQITFLKENLSKPTFDQIRLAMDYLLSAGPEYEIFRKIVLGIGVEISNTMDTMDSLGRNVMHYIMTYTKGTKGKDGNLRVELPDDSITKTDAMGISPINYFIFNPVYAQASDFFFKTMDSRSKITLKEDQGKEEKALDLAKIIPNYKFILGRFLRDDEITNFSPGERFSSKIWADFKDEIIKSLIDRIDQMADPKLKKKAEENLSRLLESCNLEEATKQREPPV